MASTGVTMSTTQQMIEQRLSEVISEASRRIAAEIAPGCPTPEFLDALGTEIESALADPSSVPYPELVDPDTYWEASVRPQGIAQLSAVRQILAWLESSVVSVMEVAEADMKRTVDAAIAHAGSDPPSVRRILEREMDRRSLELHHLLAKILMTVPSSKDLKKSKASVEERLRRQSIADVGRLKTAYLQTAGGDHAHQRFAEQQWSDTHADRVAYREALLRAEPPWRHQEIAIIGHERAIASVEQLVSKVVERLQTPLSDMSALLMEHFDSHDANRCTTQ